MDGSLRSPFAFQVDRAIETGLTAPRRVDKDEDVLALVFDDGVVVLARQDLQGGSIGEGENGETDEGIVRCGQKEISGEKERYRCKFPAKPHSAPRARACGPCYHHYSP